MGLKPNGSVAYRTPNDVPPTIEHCPNCGAYVVEGEIAGCPYRLSRFSVPYREALVLAKYGHSLINLWAVPSPVARLRRLEAADWLPPLRPSKGRLYAEHICSVWR